MLKFRYLILIGALLTLTIAGCSQDEGPLAPVTPPGAVLFGYSLPEGATLTDASFKVFAVDASFQDVDLFTATRDWEEHTVTWAGFDLYNNGYDPASLGGFTASAAMLYYAVDVTGQVMDWLSGAEANYGFLIKQIEVGSPRTEYYSRERGENPPVLEITYELGGAIITDTLEPLADAMINGTYPDQNFGAIDKLYSGWRNEAEKVSLVRFDLDVAEPELAAIGDYVWNDANMDGIQDGDEIGVAGVTVHLMDCAGNILGTDITDANGYYWFGDLQPGDYNIHFVLPDGYVFSPIDMGGDDLLDSDSDPTTGEAECTTLVAGEADPSWDAGIYRPEEQEGCTHTIGYWKTHTGLGNGNQDDMVTPLLPLWLGDAGGAKSLAVTDVYIAVDVLRQRVYGRPNNGITKLYAQLLGAKLSIADGASDMDVADAIADADAFLAEYDWNDWSTLSDEQKDDVMMWHGMFDDYNNGDIGPGHCREEGDGLAEDGHRIYVEQF